MIRNKIRNLLCYYKFWYKLGYCQFETKLIVLNQLTRIIKLWVPVLFTVQYPLPPWGVSVKLAWSRQHLISLMVVNKEIISSSFLYKVTGKSVSRENVIKMRDYQSLFVGIFFSSSLLISLIFMTLHGWFLRHFCPVTYSCFYNLLNTNKITQLQ